MRLKNLLLLVTVLLPSLGTAAGLFWWPGRPLGQSLFFVCKVLLLLLPLALRWPSRKTRPLLPKVSSHGVVQSILVGLGLTVGIFVIYLAMKARGFIDTSALLARAHKSGLSRREVYVALSLYWIIFNSFLEEWVWRGFVFEELKTLMNVKPAMVVSALAFTLHHVVALAAQFSFGITALASFGVFVAGLVFASLYERFSNMWAPYACHIILDIPVFVMGYLLLFP